MKYLKLYEELGVQAYWKVFTQSDIHILETALFKIDEKCFEHFSSMLRVFDIMIENSKNFVWIYKGTNSSMSIWEWDSDSLGNPEDEDYGHLKYMGEINVDQDDINNYEIYLSAKKYNL
jgi:hypothetical protein